MQCVFSVAFNPKVEYRRYYTADITDYANKAHL